MAVPRRTAILFHYFTANLLDDRLPVFVDLKHHHRYSALKNFILVGRQSFHNSYILIKSMAEITL